MIRFTVDSKNKTITFEGGDLEEMKEILEIFPNYNVTPYLEFDELNKSVS